MAKINALLKISILLIAMALAVVPYAAAFEIVGDDMDYILSHVSKEEFEAAKAAWARTIQLNIDEGTEIPPDLGISLNPSWSDWGMRRDPSNPDVYIMSLTGLPKKPFTEQKISTAAVEQLSPEQKESREAEKIVWTVWGNRSNDRDNVTFTVPSTGSKWLFIPINYKHTFFKYGKLDAQGRVGHTISVGEGMSLDEFIEEQIAKGGNATYLLEYKKQTEERIAKLQAEYDKKLEAEAAKSAKGTPKSDKKSVLIGQSEAAGDEPAKDVPVSEAFTADKRDKPKQELPAQTDVPDKAEESSDKETVEQKNLVEKETKKSDASEQKPKKRLSFFEKILSWFK